MAGAEDEIPIPTHMKLTIKAFEMFMIVSLLLISCL